MKLSLLYRIGLFLLLQFCILHIAFAEERLNIGEQALDFPLGKNWFAGGPLSIADNNDKKVTMIYFMKPGCGSCDKFAPHLYRLILKNKNNLEVVGVTEYPSDTIHEYLAKRFGDYPIMQDLERSFMDKYIGKINKYPYIAIINKKGELSWFGRGKFHAQVTQELNRVLGKEQVKKKNLSRPEELNSLVIGLDKSDLFSTALTTSENNAQLVTEALTHSGYDNVETLTGDDVTFTEIEKSVQNLAVETAVADTAVFYFSGEAKPKQTIDGIDLELYLKDKQISLRKIVNDFKNKSECKNLLIVIDANNEKSNFKIWEDIAGDMESTYSGVTVMLAAARWDRSLIGKDGKTTVFTEEFSRLLQAGKENDTLLTPFALWKDLRDSMSAISRETGILQSPFIINEKDFIITGK